MCNNNKYLTTEHNKNMVNILYNYDIDNINMQNVLKDGMMVNNNKLIFVIISPADINVI